MIKMEGVAAFVAVTEAGSISEAARRLRLAKSVVSERLAELEREVSAPLIHRTTRRLSLTEDGAAFLDRAKRILDEARAATADLAERRGTLAGPLRLAAPVTFGRMHLAPALIPFLKQHPAIELQLDLDDRRVDIASEGYDAVLRHGPIVDSRLIVWRLATSRRLLVASPDYLEANGAPASLDDLSDHRGLFYANRGVADWRFDTLDGSRIVRTDAALVTNNGDILLDAALGGLGIALLPSFIAGEAVRDGRLSVLDVGWSPAPEFVFMAHPEGRRSSAKLRALAAHLKAAFGDPPYWNP
ncbi:LysR substrate-binding domain-containing protein [Asticcacaulis sp. BYS171W]|uniref:LysR substrate-binding domain-containing protein n=1 Tax=Asticcacaulis aquaticus TaxID=2984212 RepID=A0ABT5HVW1_9CAUL|nr:LysR family transcriptional regulator [Asticcacaulis aquaticus]MDC7684222.1 LysR substrate-binding domain-containing protein [Asticcacaulis aquaticus]